MKKTENNAPESLETNQKAISEPKCHVCGKKIRKGHGIYSDKDIYCGLDCLLKEMREEK